ncbi:MAG: helix-turn-helix domain-containing protein [Alphaproteobacteria bacterium]|nr:helix-turn-helix domain-containing protein [Alphaproteobacteria bacterium]
MLNVNHRRRREKVFGPGRSIPLDRNAKARILTLARALARPTAPGRHYGALTGKFVDVLRALIFVFHNCQSGRCFPSYEAIAEAAGCARATVAAALDALERTGILVVQNRLVRVRETGQDLFGRGRNRWRVVRTSNSYSFVDPQARPRFSSKAKFSTGTANQDSNIKPPIAAKPELDLGRALQRLKEGVLTKLNENFEASRRIRAGTSE